MRSRTIQGFFVAVAAIALSASAASAQSQTSFPQGDGAPPANDTCATATELVCPPDGGTVTVLGSTLDATFTGPFDCFPTSHGVPEVWYRVAGTGGDIEVTTCTYSMPIVDTKITVFDGSCGSFECVGASDNDCDSGQGGFSTVPWTSELGTDYFVMVHGWEVGDFQVTLTCAGPCEILATPAITAVGDTTCGGVTSQAPLQLVWSDVANEIGYQWEIRDTLNNLMSFGETGADVTTVNAGTVGPGRYVARVRALGDGVDFCDGDWSETCPFEIPGPCETLETPAVTGVGDTTCGGTTPDTTPVVTWSDVENESGYRWEIRDTVFNIVVSSGETGPDVTTASSGELIPGRYMVRVQAFGDDVDFCDSDWSESCPFDIVDCDVLAAPAVTGVGDTTCGGSTSEAAPTLTWEDVDNESGYRWEVRDGSDVVVSSGTTGPNVTTATVGALDFDTYSARVQAVGDGVDFCDGEWSSNCEFEIVSDAGTADFTWWPDQPKQGERVRFADLSTGVPASWSWESGDGWTSTEQHPWHVFEQVGEHEVSLETRYGSSQDTISRTVTVSGVVTCGDGVCDGGETMWSCPSDCGLGEQATGRAGGSDRRPTVPAAVGGVAGTGGTFWMTEGWVYNPGSEAVQFLLEYTAIGDEEVLTSGPFDLAPLQGLYWENLVEDLFDTTGNGALWLDSAKPVHLLTRSYNLKPGGTFGQGVPGIRDRLAIGQGEGEVFLIGLREDSDFRSNLFFQEVDGAPVTVRIEVFDDTGTRLVQRSVDVAGHSAELRSLRGLGLAEEASLYATVEVTDGDGRVAAIGSVVDNITGDPTTVDPIHLDQLPVAAAGGGKDSHENHQLVAVVAHTEGAAGSVWRTKFVIENPESSGEETIRVVYVAEYDRTGPVGESLETTWTLAAGHQKTWNDVLVDLFALPASAGTQGALHVYSSERLMIRSRTFNERSDGGTLGQEMKALAEGDLVDLESEGTIVGLGHSFETRTNMGVAVFSDEETEVELGFYATHDESRHLGTLTRTVPAQSHLQITRVFEELGLPNEPLTGVVVRVSVTGGGPAYVYASMVDNASGDATTLVTSRE